MKQSSLVLELQHSASDLNSSVSSILLKAKMVAVKLGLNDIGQQIDREMTGYKPPMKTGEMPDYRWVIGKIHIANPYRGMVPVTFASVEDERLVSKCFVPNSIAEIEDCTHKDDGAYWTMGLTEVQNNYLRRNLDHLDLPIHNILSKTALVSILNAVRTSILNWSLDLERRGIMGDGLSFTQQEKTAAIQDPISISIGSIGTMQGSIGPAINSTITQNLDQKIVTNDLRTLLSKLLEAGVSQEDADALKGAIIIEPEPVGGKIGSKVGAWIGGMAAKAAVGVWSAAKEKGTEYLISLIKAYYGISV